ncbi:MAG: sigma-54-dependent Fis family transcriptional regulator [Gemmatimonadetes bacterium]|nr:sigma-54-dependent Fis family transcriptional regulator [Gemmatimonadota bacterium]
MATILCVDDEPSVGVVLEAALAKLGHTSILAGSVDDAMKAVSRQQFDLIISDYRMPNATGLDLLGLLEKEGHQIPVIIMTGYSSVEHAVMSLRSGAIDYLTKPVRQETLRIAVTQALEVIRLRKENETFRQELSGLRGRRQILGESEPMRRVLEIVSTVAPTKATVLLQGESGTGKELIARAIHEQSPRRDRPFITINCAAMPEGLVESALFGHEKGAFTGATARTQGAFERAHGGTLLLDEISEMRLDLQAKLLRVIQEQEFERVGGQQSIRVDVRLVATTNRDLKAEADAGKFRQDLYYRLNVVPIHLPPLRERLDDIPVLVHNFVGRAAQQLGIEVTGVTPEAVATLQQRTWPGNIRELANVVERAVILSRGGVLRPDAFVEDAALTRARPAVPASPAGTPTPVASIGGAPMVDPAAPTAATLNLEELEAITIQRALAATGGNRTKASKLLGISERTLRNKLNTPKAPTAS